MSTRQLFFGYADSSQSSGPLTSKISPMLLFPALCRLLRPGTPRTYQFGAGVKTPYNWRGRGRKNNVIKRASTEVASIVPNAMS